MHILQCIYCKFDFFFLVTSLKDFVCIFDLIYVCIYVYINIAYAYKYYFYGSVTKYFIFGSVTSL